MILPYKTKEIVCITDCPNKTEWQRIHFTLKIGSVGCGNCPYFDGEKSDSEIICNYGGMK
jgi:hypothetical protein